MNKMLLIRPLMVLCLSLTIGLGLAQAGETLQMQPPVDAPESIVLVANNPCGSSLNPCNPCQQNPCNPCGKKQNPCQKKMNPCDKDATNPCHGSSMNPCQKKMNPCHSGSMNPCQKKKNPCAGSDKSSQIDPALITRPAGTQLYANMDRSSLVARGEQLFKDSSLSSNGLNCKACHSTDALFKDSFTQPYPHRVVMASDQAGMATVELDEFVQFCLLKPMASKTLPWESADLAALTAYMADVKQQSFIANRSMNPCGAKQTVMNPCAVTM